MSVNFWICFCSQNRQYVMRIIQNNAIFLGLSAWGWEFRKECMKRDKKM